MTILDKIIAEKKIEISERKKATSISDFEKEFYFERNCISLKNNLLQSKSGIIAEFKRKSPSKGWIKENADVLEITSGYYTNGASGISILTDLPFFGGTPEDLISMRPNVNCPILRKDFIIDEYQLYEAKAMGADVILLIAAALSISETKNLAKIAKSLGLEVLLEIHNQEELNHINDFVDIVGVNNRNLKTFEVNLQISKDLATLIPERFVKISESGISNSESVKELRKYGFQGFLMGENFMKDENPAESLKEFISEVAP
ncbi:Indole-3-glycerol phosphate synthase [uncultured Paludibacter sp.]|uniref:Indole-3-glycerol phosphate synthase n=1 Tax=uncultured Paludibacter sp. TaxID=497635 RepID=A0A653AAE7_9BACT|nr:Indole-3-glycerol phosphate synthase [uncultured Paludibacter sp.]